MPAQRSQDALFGHPLQPILGACRRVTFQMANTFRRVRCGTFKECGKNGKRTATTWTIKSKGCCESELASYLNVPRRTRRNAYTV